MSLTNKHEELYDLLEQAAENATGRDDVDIGEYCDILEDEWITDVDGLRRLDSDALDELLPLLLSRELQRLIHNERRRTYFNRNRRWRRNPPQMERSGSKPRKSSAKNKKDTPPEVIPVCEEEWSESSSVGIEDMRCHNPLSAAAPTATVPPPPKPLSPTEVLAASAMKAKKQRRKKSGLSLVKMFDLMDHWCSYSFKEDGEPNEILMNPSKAEEGIDDDVLQRMSTANPFMVDATERANHLIADASRRAKSFGHARNKFSSREALEDAIHELKIKFEQEQQEAMTATVDAAGEKESGFHPKEKLLTFTAEDELRELYPLRLMLPTVGDLMEMIKMLQIQRERAMRKLDMDKANIVQWEIDELQSQINEEERYLLKKKLNEMGCVACGEKFAIPLGETTMTVKEKHCDKCRKVFGNEKDYEKHQPSVLERILSMATTEDGKNDEKSSPPITII